MRALLKSIVGAFLVSSASASWNPVEGAQLGQVEREAPTHSLRLDLSLTRVPATGPDRILTTASASLAGAPLPGLDLSLDVQGGSGPAFEDRGDGTYTTTVTPSDASGEVRIGVGVVGTPLRVTKTALVLPVVAAHWGQAERVPGLVNTFGWEDSCEISPDGEWLIVGVYSPIDLLCCLLGCNGDPNDSGSVDCNVSLGPYGAPARPELLGVERILSEESILHEAPSLGLFAPLPFALPPVAGYGFRRALDGSFRDPFVIGFEMDGFTYTAFGFSFVAAPVEGQVELVFGFPDPRTTTGNDVFWADVQLGGKVSLGTYQYSQFTGITADPFHPVQLPLADVAGNQGNPHFANNALWFDSEGEPEVDVLVATHSGSLPGGTFQPAVTAGFSAAGRAEVQPYWYGGRLYFGTDVGIRSSLYVGGAYEAAGSWGAEVPELVGEGAGVQRPGAILNVGEPSFANTGSGEWMYFVYVLRTATGFDANIGRVRRL